MFNIKGLKLKTKLILTSALLVLITSLGILLITLSIDLVTLKNNINEFRSYALENEKAKLKQVIEVAYRTIEHIYKETGDQEQAKSAIKAIRYAGGNYIWIHSYTKTPVMIMHPIATQLDGKDVSDFYDVKKFKKVSYLGTVYDKDSPIIKENIKPINLFIDMNQAIQKTGNDGFVGYYWPKPKIKDIGFAKTSYIKLFKQWNWVIGTGVYIDHIDNLVAIEKANLYKSIRHKIALTIIVTLALIIVSIFISFFVTNQIVLPLNEVVLALTNISQGDLTVSLELDPNQNDEIGDIRASSMIMVHKLRELIQTVRESSGQVGDNAEILSATFAGTGIAISQVAKAITTVAHGNASQVDAVNEILEEMQSISNAIDTVSQGNSKQVESTKSASEIVNKNDQDMQDLTQAAVEQAQSVENTKDIISQMANAIDQVTKEASEVSENSMQTAEIAKEGQEIVAITVNGMNNIEATVLEAANKISELGANSSQIGEIIEVIDDIAEQTNLLALNAAIEAARAGEHGRGFAVVADEVRKLAERSSSATKEIANLIKKIQDGTEAAVESMNAGTDEVQKGSQLVEQSKVALANIIEAVQNTVNQIQNISAAAEEMSASSNEVVQTIDKIAEISEKNTNKINDITASTKQVVEATMEIQTISENNLSETKIIEERYNQVIEKANTISEIAQDNSSSAEEVSASTEEMAASINELDSKSESLKTLSAELVKKIDIFEV